jgi:hypothetical protein
MDRARLDRYRTIVHQLMEEYASYIPVCGDVRMEIIVDHEHGHYELIEVGWNGNHRVHCCIFHIDILNGKVWIEHNATDRDIGEELVATGIPRQDIVLGFQPPELRPHTRFGVG